MMNNRPLIQAVGLEPSEYVEESRSERKTGYRWMTFVIRKVNFGISCKRLYLGRRSAQTFEVKSPSNEISCCTALSWKGSGLRYHSGLSGLNGIQEVVGSIPIGSTKFLNGLWVTDRPEDSAL
jgi:hypothetical protein